MPLYIYKCSSCDKTDRKLANRNDYTCSECGAPMSKDVLSSIKQVNFDRVPGGYEATKLTEYRQSKEGQEAEAAFLATQSLQNSPY